MILLALKNDTIKGPPLLQLCSPGIIELFVCAFTWLCAIILVYNCKCVIALSERAAWQSWLWLCSQTRCASITINETYIANETWWKCGVENLSGFRMQAKGRVLVFFLRVTLCRRDSTVICADVFEEGDGSLFPVRRTCWKICGSRKFALPRVSSPSG